MPARRYISRGETTAHALISYRPGAAEERLIDAAIESGDYSGRSAVIRGALLDSLGRRYGQPGIPGSAPEEEVAHLAEAAAETTGGGETPIE